MGLGIPLDATLAISSPITCQPTGPTDFNLVPIFSDKSIHAVPVQAAKTLWTEQSIDLQRLLELGRLKTDRDIINAMSAQGIRVGVAHPSSSDLAKIKSQLNTKSENSEVTKLNEEIRDFQNQDPQVIQFTQIFQSIPARGQFIPKGVQPFPTTSVSTHPTILLKNFAGRASLLHEYTHFLIGEARERSGTPDPWYGKGAELPGAAIQRHGEELDVARTIVENRDLLGLSTDISAIQSALQNFRDDLDQIKNLPEAMKVKEKIEESERWYSKTLEDLSLKDPQTNREGGL